MLVHVAEVDTSSPSPGRGTNLTRPIAVLVILVSCCYLMGLASEGSRTMKGTRMLTRVAVDGPPPPSSTARLLPVEDLRCSSDRHAGASNASNTSAHELVTVLVDMVGEKDGDFDTSKPSLLVYALSGKGCQEVQSYLLHRPQMLNGTYLFVVSERSNRCPAITKLCKDFACLDVGDASPTKSDLKGSHYSHRFAMAKLAAYMHVPAALDKVILLDADVVPTREGVFDRLWALFDGFNSTTLMALARSHSNIYMEATSQKDVRHLMHGHPGPNSGVVLYDLKHLREYMNSTRDRMPWWNAVAGAMSQKQLICADQDIFAVFQERNPDRAMTLPCQFNVESEGHSYFTETVVKGNKKACRDMKQSQQQQCLAFPELLHYNAGYHNPKLVKQDIDFIASFAGEVLEFPACGPKDRCHKKTCCRDVEQCDVNMHSFGSTIESVTELHEKAVEYREVFDDKR